MRCSCTCEAKGVTFDHNDATRASTWKRCPGAPPSPPSRNRTSPPKPVHDELWPMSCGLRPPLITIAMREQGNRTSGSGMCLSRL